MNRRDLIALLGGAAVWPAAARAQQAALPVVGFLGFLTNGLLGDRVRPFRQGLGETGYVEGQNVVIEYRWADGQYDRLPALAEELVRREVTVIAATGATPSALAAKAATTKIPIVFAIGADPVQLGLVTSLNRPGGNLTGVTSLAGELVPKLVELLHEIAPAATKVGLLINPTSPNAELLSSGAQAAARAFGLQVQILQATIERELEGAFAASVELRAGGVVIAPDPLFANRIEQLVALQVRHAMPTIYNTREFAAAGGLMGYGSNVTDTYRLVGVYVGRILKGEKPANLPVQQATKVELIINLKAAKTLGITVPLALLTRADEVIE